MKPDAGVYAKHNVDLGESIAMMEPLLFSQGSRHRRELNDLVLELVKKSSAVSARLPEKVLSALGTLVRSLNCYYSNLIDGHRTHIADIERAINNNYSSDPATRDLQLEAKSHLQVQHWVENHISTRKFPTTETLCEIHRQFFGSLPESFRWTTMPDSDERHLVIPGYLRVHHVQVGRHLSISSGAVPRFMQRFEQVYCELGVTDTLLALAAAHHRLVWIHPFPDGNGRVARLMSDAMLRSALATGGVWTVSRGLARNNTVYKSLLANCDMSRRNDRDGRGTLSEEALADLTEFFLATCIDQIQFMERLIEPERLRTRIAIWAETEIRSGALPSKSGIVLEAVLARGALPRSDAVSLLGVSERQARRITSALIRTGALSAKTSRAPLTLAFPSKLAADWLPGILPG